MPNALECDSFAFASNQDTLSFRTCLRVCLIFFPLLFGEELPVNDGFGSYLHGDNPSVKYSGELATSLFPS